MEKVKGDKATLLEASSHLALRTAIRGRTHGDDCDAVTLVAAGSMTPKNIDSNIEVQVLSY